MKILKSIVSQVLCFAALAFYAPKLAPIYGGNFLDDYASYIGANNYRLFYESHGMLPYQYGNVDQSVFVGLEFVDTNLIRSQNNKLVYHVTPHFTPCPYLTVDSIVSFRNEWEDSSFI